MSFCAYHIHCCFPIISGLFYTRDQPRPGAKTGASLVADSAASRRLLLPPAPRLWHPKPRTPSREVADIRTRTARTVERRTLRIESRGSRVRLSKNRYKCGHCRVTCYGEANWRDHRASRRHLSKDNPPRLPRCVACHREFESQAHYDRHLRGEYHLRTVNKKA